LHKQVELIVKIVKDGVDGQKMKEHAYRLFKCHRRNDRYCSFIDNRCEYIGREFACSVYRFDCIEKDLTERMKRERLRIEKLGE
jgi:hypothetical protein